MDEPGIGPEVPVVPRNLFGETVFILRLRSRTGTGEVLMTSRLALALVFSLWACSDDAEDVRWVRLDLSTCSFVDVDAEYAHGTWAGPWESGTMANDRAAAYALSFLPVLDHATYGEAHFEIEGVFADSRYMSLQLYDSDGVYEDHLRDIWMHPADGSVSPFLEGHPMPPEEQRRYSVAVLDPGKEAVAAASVLHGDRAQDCEVKRHRLLLRYYDPARAEGQYPGLVDPPRTFFVYPEDTTLEAVPRTVEDVCKLFDPAWYEELLPRLEIDAKAEAAAAGVMALAGKINVDGYQPESHPEFDEPHWLFGADFRCTMNYLFPEGSTLLETPEAPEGCAVETAPYQYNMDQCYLYAFLDPRRAEATVTRMKVPRTAKRGDRLKDEDYQVRYWSVCATQPENYMFSYACLMDHDAVRDCAASAPTDDALPRGRAPAMTEMIMTTTWRRSASTWRMAWMGIVTACSADGPGATVPPSIDELATAAEAALLETGHEVTRGEFRFFLVDDCLDQPTCYGNNPTSPYGLAMVPGAGEAPGASEGDNPAFVEATWPLAAADAVVLLGTAPPGVRYYSFTPCLFDRQTDDGRVTLFASLADPAIVSRGDDPRPRRARRGHPRRRAAGGALPGRAAPAGHRRERRPADGPDAGGDVRRSGGGRRLPGLGAVPRAARAHAGRRRYRALRCPRTAPAHPAGRRARPGPPPRRARAGRGGVRRRRGDGHPGGLRGGPRGRLRVHLRGAHLIWKSHSRLLS
jgi:hypothetical protein